MKKLQLLSLIALLLAACAPAAKDPAEAQLAAEAEPTRVPFMMAGDIFTSSPQEFMLSAEVLGSDYAAADAGSASPNSRLLELRADGQAYIEATGRLDGYQQQFNRSAGSGPLYIINVVNIYETADGPHAVLSRDWHADVWNRIDSGELTQLPNIENLPVAEQLVWQDANGTIGVELAYRNLYILLTGPTDSGDQSAFFADLARNYISWIQAGEPN